MGPDLVIFDCDGVLVDSERIANRVMAEALGEIGLPMTFEETVRTFMGRSMSACVEIMERRLGKPVPAGFVENLQVRTLEAFSRELGVVSGIERVLDGLDAAGTPYCVASNGEHEKIRFSLGHTGLLSRFEGRIFSAVDVPRGKPHPDLFLHAARVMGCEPSRCAVVEDGVFGVRAAVAAGMEVFGFAAHADAGALGAEGARVFDDMTELPALLDSF